MTHPDFKGFIRVNAIPDGWTYINVEKIITFAVGILHAGTTVITVPDQDPIVVIHDLAAVRGKIMDARS